MPFLPYPPTTTEAAIAILKQDIAITHNIVHGNDSTVVDTESGIVPSFAKAIADSNTVKLVNTSNAGIDIDSSDQAKHFLCSSNQPVTVTMNSAGNVEITNKGVTVFFTQMGEGTVTLVGANGIQLVHPQDSTPTTYDKGSTIAAIAVSSSQWIVAGNLGY